MKRKWQNLNKVEQKQLLKDIFFNKLFDHQHLPAFMTEQDWSELFEGAKIDNIPIFSGHTYTIVLFLETFAYRYWIPDSNQFLILENFLKDSFALVRVENADLFEFCSLENSDMKFKFNMQAVFLYMFQQQQ